MPRCSKPLSDVVCLVDTVNSDGIDASSSYIKILESLGATISTTLGENLTHLVSLNSNAKRVAAATLLGIHVVSPLWIEQCRESGTRASEAEFMVTNNVPVLVSAMPTTDPGMEFTKTKEPELDLVKTRRSLDSPFFSSSQRILDDSIAPERALATTITKRGEKTIRRGRPSQQVPVQAVSVSSDPVIPIPSYRPYELPDLPPELKRRRSERISDRSDDDDNDIVTTTPPSKKIDKKAIERNQKNENVNKSKATTKSVDPHELLPVIQDFEWPPSDELIASKRKMPRLDVDKLVYKDVVGAPVGSRTLTFNIGNSSNHSSSDLLNSTAKNGDNKTEGSRGSLESNSSPGGRKRGRPPKVPKTDPKTKANVSESTTTSTSKKVKPRRFDDIYFDPACKPIDNCDLIALSGLSDVTGEKSTFLSIIQGVIKCIKDAIKQGSAAAAPSVSFNLTASVSSSSSRPVRASPAAVSTTPLPKFSRVQILRDSDDPTCSSCKYLIAPIDCKRTLKILFAMARGIPILLPEWATQCLSAESWVSPKEFLHPIYNMSETKSMGHLFEGITPYIGFCSDPHREIFKALLETVGAVVTDDIYKASCLMFGDSRDAHQWLETLSSADHKLREIASVFSSKKLIFTRTYVFNCISERVLRYQKFPGEDVSFPAVKVQTQLSSSVEQTISNKKRSRVREIDSEETQLEANVNQNSYKKKMKDNSPAASSKSNTAGKSRLVGDKSVKSPAANAKDSRINSLPTSGSKADRTPIRMDSEPALLLNFGCRSSPRMGPSNTATINTAASSSSLKTTPSVASKKSHGKSGFGNSSKTTTEAKQKRKQKSSTPTQADPNDSGQGTKSAKANSKAKEDNKKSMNSKSNSNSKSGTSSPASGEKATSKKDAMLSDVQSTVIKQSSKRKVTATSDSSHLKASKGQKTKKGVDRSGKDSSDEEEWTDSEDACSKHGKASSSSFTAVKPTSRFGQLSQQEGSQSSAALHEAAIIALSSMGGGKTTRASPSTSPATGESSTRKPIAKALKHAEKKRSPTIDERDEEEEEEDDDEIDIYNIKGSQSSQAGRESMNGRVGRADSPSW